MKSMPMPERGFNLSNGRYYYCAHTNTLINSEFREIYSKNCQKRTVEVDDINIDIDSVKSSLKAIKQIIFEITQSCGLNCRYCIYESGYYHLNRSGSSKSLQISKAEKVLKYVWQIVKDRYDKNMTIGLYGGEPIKEIDNIKRIVGFSKKIFAGWQLSYTITTNATLLNDHILGYLIENNFLVFVSLDGPLENHDAKRLFRNGKGSYRVVMDKLKRIKEINADFYTKNVTLSAVYSKDLSFEKMFDFFLQEELVKNSNINLGFVNESDTGYYDHHPYDAGKFRESRNKIFSAVLEKKQRKIELLPIEANLLRNHNLKAKSLGMRKFTSLMGACFFDSRLYVDADGGFHICEKMNDKFQFGNADEGFDYQKMVTIITGYTEFLKRNCMKCEYNFLCHKCYIHFAKNGIFEMDAGFCENQKYSLKKILEELIEMERPGVK